MWSALLLTAAAPLAAASGLWSSTPAELNDTLRQAYAVGNGRLGFMPFGPPGDEKINLNIDTLWWGGPFEASNYTGGNPLTPVSQYLEGIRDWIFTNGTGNITAILGSMADYGSSQVLGNMSVSIDGITATTAYNRSLDLSTGVHTTTYTANDNNTYTITVYCSYPDSVCVYDLSSTGTLPGVSIYIENELADPSVLTSTCGSGFARMTGYTQLGPPLGMKYDSIARVAGKRYTTCDNSTGTLSIPSSHNTSTLTLIFAAGTNYDQTKGNPAANFSFRGADPSPIIEKQAASAANKSETSIRNAHIKDYSSYVNRFSLNLPDTAGSAGLETSEIIQKYSVYNTDGDPYLEKTLFDLGRHLLISSSRDNSLPPNLQGIWANLMENPWDGDYHLDINLQMNYWGVDQTGLGDLQVPLWNFIENTWVPRGEQTAQLVYGGEGWITHGFMNTFGHTGLIDTAEWTDFTETSAWMMQHVFDHWDYSQDSDWYASQGYPILKGVAEFWLSQIQYDRFFNDGTIVVVPCNSPEQGPTTFACTHYQQLLYQVFDNVLAGADAAGETDQAFLANVSSTIAHLDTGLHIGSWGEIKEWKLPDSWGYDWENNTHRHLSHLIGWYPGWSISSYQDGYTNATIQDAVTTSLWSRGNGTGDDGNAGWEKVWRSACWARLNNTERAYFELRYAIDENYSPNGLSMYVGDPVDPEIPFQIDANFGLVGAMLSMLIVDLPSLSTYSGSRIVVLGPAIPASWGGGSVQGLRIRGGGSVDFSWDDDGLVTEATSYDIASNVELVNVAGTVLN